MARHDEQISHGLNLVLRLRDPARMKELLLRIRQAQPKIDAGLGELNFVHFARFLPTYDNAALQVVTEFDGPLDPYVLDFAIEIGDVFDMLLGFTQGTEHMLPIADHPAEFLAFVKENNTIRVPGLPDNPDLSLYSAYPQTSALDIIGPRTDLPIPKADRWVTPVADADIQGNILRGFAAERVRHFVLEVFDPAEARRWLADRAGSGAGAPGVPTVTSGQTWVGAKPPVMLNVGLTHAGMNALGVRPAWLARFPEAFRQGALQRAAGNADILANAPDHWWLGERARETAHHVMVSLYRSKDPAADAAFTSADAALRASLPAGGFRLIDEADAVWNGGSNWFGYADSITSPRIASADAPKPGTPVEMQPASTAGEFVLGNTYRNIYGGTSLGSMPGLLAGNGSFCAVRVLAQDVALFRRTLKSEAQRVGYAEDWLAAKLMGRWYGGAPLSLYPDPAPNPPQSRNDFDYAPSYEYPDTPMDHAGERCPVGAHIRRGNARSSRVAGARYARRLMRRGMHYTRMVDGKEEKGLFGLFMCADLERQFEFIQREWMNGDRFAAGLRGTRDPFVGTVEGALQDFEIPLPGGATLTLRLPPFVQTRGSLYLFMPGLNALRELDHFAAFDPPAQSA